MLVEINDARPFFSLTRPEGAEACAAPTTTATCYSYYYTPNSTVLTQAERGNAAVRTSKAGPGRSVSLLYVEKRPRGGGTPRMPALLEAALTHIIASFPLCSLPSPPFPFDGLPNGN